MVEAGGLDKASLSMAVQAALLELTQQDKRKIEEEKMKNLELEIVVRRQQQMMDQLNKLMMMARGELGGPAGPRVSTSSSSGHAAPAVAPVLLGEMKRRSRRSRRSMARPSWARRRMM